MFGGRKPPTSSGNTPSAQAGTTQQPPTPVARQPVGFETVLGANSTLKGELKSVANVRLDGTFEGSLNIEGNILVGETAKITANIHAKNISIAGAVRGDVSGNKIQLLRTGRVWGDITATAITTEEGAFIDGKITMVGHPALTAGFEPVAMPALEAAPLAEDAVSGEPVEAELVDDHDVPRNSSDKP